MAATPLEQEVVAEATIFTDDPTVLPFPGLLIVTPAKAETDARLKMHRQMHSGACFLVTNVFLLVFFYFLDFCEPIENTRDRNRRKKRHSRNTTSRKDRNGSQIFLGIERNCERSLESIHALPDCQRESAVKSARK
jgi:hypothetical protein